MGIFSRLFGRAEESGSEPAGSPEPANPIEEKLRQSDEDRLAEQKKKLEELPEDEQRAWVPKGDIETQRAADEEANPSK